MKFISTLALALLFATNMLTAQTDFRPGYIITNAGDTVYGKIDYRGDLYMSSKCKFKYENDSICKYSPHDIHSFRFIDGKYYVSRELKDKKAFLEYLVNGEVSFYYMRDELGNHYYVDKEGEPLKELLYRGGLHYVEDTEVEVYNKSTNHLGVLYHYMKDAPELKPKINTVTKPEHKSLVRIAEEYHTTVCSDKECLVYEKPFPKIYIIPEITAGVIRSALFENVDSDLLLVAGFIGHIGMPKRNEKLFFRTGILYSRPYLDKKNRNIFKIPVQIEYIYPKGIFRPRFAYGLNMYGLAGLPSCNIGGNIKLSDKLSLTGNMDLEFKPRLLVLPKAFAAYSYLVGLSMNIN